MTDFTIIYWKFCADCIYPRGVYISARSLCLNKNDSPPADKMSHSESKNSTPPEQKMPTPPAKIAHNNKDYNKTNIHTSIHAISAYANAKEGITKEGNKNGEKNSFQRLLPGGSWRVATEGVACSFASC